MLAHRPLAAAVLVFAALGWDGWEAGPLMTGVKLMDAAVRAVVAPEI